MEKKKKKKKMSIEEQKIVDLKSSQMYMYGILCIFSKTSSLLCYFKQNVYLPLQHGSL